MWTSLATPLRVSRRANPRVVARLTGADPGAVRAASLHAATPQELAVLQTPSGPPMPEITGTALPMA